MSVLANLQRFGTEDARQFAYRILKFSILELLLRPGEKLNEAELAGSLQMSRTPVRDVLGRLGRENLVDQIPQRGAFVSRIRPARAQQAAWAQARTGTAVLDVLYAARLSAPALEPLRKNLARQQFSIAMEDRVGAVRTALEFYATLYELAGMGLVWASLQRAGADLRRLSYLAGTARGGCESTLLECRSMVEALAQHDGIAASRALNHCYERLCRQIAPLQQEHPELFESTDAAA